MTIIEAINRIDSLKHNTYSQSDKVEWLSTLDGMVKLHIIDNHEGADEVIFNGYDSDTNLDTELLVPAPFDSMYLRWLEAQIDYHNGEYGRYNNAILVFNTDFDGYRNYYNRNHMPTSVKMKYFGEPDTKQYQSANSVVKITVEEV